MPNQKHQNSLEQRILRLFHDNRLIAGQQRLLIAVSGGPDSVCLLHILFLLRKKLNIELHIAHLDHCLRGAESEADAAYVARLAFRLGLPATIEARDVKSFQVRHRLSGEEAAREVRYTFLAEVAELIGADRVAVGHTADDHIETILMHLIRGTGIRGLVGLQPVSRWRSQKQSLTILRPLLEVTRQETEDYCRKHRLKPRLDVSNLALSPLRNRIRRQLVPLLENYNPRIKDALSRAARLAADDLDSLNQISARLSPDLMQRRKAAISFERKAFSELPVGLQRHVLREATAELLGTLKDIEAHHIDEIIEVAGKPAGKMLNLPGGMVFLSEYSRFWLTVDPVSLTSFPEIKGSSVLNIPGETMFCDWRITATISSLEEMKEMDDNFTAYLCLDSSGENLKVRSRKPGDRFQPLGMNQSKELTEFMIDAKIPRAWRARIPIVCTSEQILWVVGWRLNERVKVTSNTRQVLKLQFEMAHHAV